MNELNTKDIRKVAFAVGFGLAFGKSMAGLVNTAMDAAVTSTLKSLAKKDNPYAQDICRKLNIEYEESHEENKSEVTMGFHG